MIVRALALSLVLAGPALADTAQASWRRVVTPDGAAAVQVPCGEGDMQTRTEGGTSGTTCTSGGLRYALVVGRMGGSAEDKAEGSFDQMMADAKKDAGTDEVRSTTVAGRRAFTATRKEGSGVGLVQMIDFQPGRPILAMAASAGAVSAADRSTALASARRFIDSLEVIAK